MLEKLFKKGLTKPQSEDIGEYERLVASRIIPHARRQHADQLHLYFERADDCGDITDQQALFGQMEAHDAHLLSEMNKRKMAVALLDWSLVLPEDATAKEEAVREFVQSVLENLSLRSLFTELLSAIGMGFDCIELHWKEQEGKWIVSSWQAMPGYQFKMDTKTGELKLILSGTQETSLESPKWLVHKVTSRSGLPTETALYRTLAWIYLYKTYTLDDWAKFLERFAIPTRIGKYQAGAAEHQRAELLKALKGLGNDSYGVIPDSMAIEFLHTSTSGTGGQSAIFLEQIKYLDGLISKAVLGGTLTSGADGKASTNALGNVHNEVRHELKEIDALALAETINHQLIAPLIRLNFGDGVRTPTFAFDLWKPLDRKETLEGLRLAVEMGVKVPVDYVHEVLNLPKAEKDEEVLILPQVESPKDKTKKTANQATTQALAMLAQQDKERDDLDGWIDTALEGKDGADALLGTVLKGMGEIADEAREDDNG